jgi:hypothetical protein
VVAVSIASMERAVTLPPTPSPQLPDVIESSDAGDRSSVTDVNGTVAKFEMAYNPEKSDRFAFGPPILARLPGLAFLAFAALIGLTVLAAYNGSSNTKLYIWVVEGDRHRVFGSGPLAFVILFAAIGNVLKTALRGVIVTADAVEARMLVAGFPRVRRWTWAQIDRLVIDEDDVMLELWDGTYERLPKVRHGQKLAELLARIATARGRSVTRLAAGPKR